jgi:hypothetical protein
MYYGRVRTEKVNELTLGLWRRECCEFGSCEQTPAVLVSRQKDVAVIQPLLPPDMVCWG